MFFPNQVEWKARAAPLSPVSRFSFILPTAPGQLPQSAGLSVYQVGAVLSSRADLSQAHRSCEHWLACFPNFYTVCYVRCPCERAAPHLPNERI